MESRHPEACVGLLVSGLGPVDNSSCIVLGLVSAHCSVRMASRLRAGLLVGGAGSAVSGYRALSVHSLGPVHCMCVGPGPGPCGV